MGCGRSPAWASETKEKEAEPAESIAGVRLADAPILLLVFFHKALRAELAELHRLTLSSWETGPPERDLILDLLRRYRFLKLAYKYHCAAEDEVIFQALDLRVRNVACTYSLEHRSIDDLFESVFKCLGVLLDDDGNLSKPFQELVFCTGTIETSICQHMLKEEEQVFPLLVQRFSSEEQASLVWQFMSSVPVMLLEDFLPWMASYLSLDEQADIMLCIKEVVPKEELLQEVVTSWLGKKSQYFGGYKGGVNEKRASHLNQPLNLKLSKVYFSKKNLTQENWHWRGSESLLNDVRYHPVDGLRLWHGAIKKDLKEILEELHEIRNSKSFSTLASVTSQLKFLADVLIFYSDALERVFFPVLNELADGCLSFSHQWFLDESRIEALLQLLQNFDALDGTSLSILVGKLCGQLESFMMRISKHLAFQETEVFPIIRKRCDHEMQQWLLYTSIHMMPLGLLKCVITWLSAHLTEDESKAVLCSIKLAGPLVDKSYLSLLHEWVRIGYSGKTSLEKFRKELQETFKNRSCFLSEQIEETGLASLDLDVQDCQGSHSSQKKPNSTREAKRCDSSFFTHHNTEKRYNTSYSSGINLQIFFPGALKKLSFFPKFSAEKCGAGSSLNPKPRPIDHIFLFHKALKNDLAYLVIGSTKVVENVGFLMEFCQRFHLLWLLYQIHCDAEDEIAFPALEAKGKFQNISHSYSIDHRLDRKHFSNISNILDEISELHLSPPSVTSNVVDVATLDQRKLRYHKLCMKLHGMCKSLNKSLEEHIHREEIELWPLFTECFSNKEQEKIIGSILGRTRAEILQEMIPWLMASLTPKEQEVMMSIWRSATKNTMFDEWLGEWWDDMNRYDITKVIEESSIPPSGMVDPLEVVATYLSKEAFDKPKGRTLHDERLTFPREDFASCDFEPSGNVKGDDKTKTLNENQDKYQFSECTEICNEGAKQRYNKVLDVTDQVEKPDQILQVDQKIRHQEEHLLTMSQEDLEATIRRISRDASLDPQKKSYIIQNLLMSRWIVAQKMSYPEVTLSSNMVEIPGQCPSYRDPLKQTLGCKHYKRNCKLLAVCCNKLFTCRYCHDDVSDHSMDRKSTTKMMCMKCLRIQPIGHTCMSCRSLSMARYFCSICKLFDDERDIYHCPYCNLCRVGKGLGIDYFHCMNCNACMSKSLAVHICIEKCFMSNCPICHEYIFTSSSPVKALPCGHLMHSTCFQDYTCTHYTCPICSKSLGDMQVYFGMLDALLVEEKIPQEYAGQTQDILCNDCDKRGITPFHWLYHKCPHCGSYNTRLI